MRLPICCVLAAAALSACAGPKIDIAAEEAAVRARSQALATAEASMNTDAALAFWAKDAVAQAPGNPQIQDLATMRKMYDGIWPTIKSFQGTTSKVIVAQSGDLAWEYGVNRFVIGTPKGDLLDMGKYFLVWKKTSGEWYVAGLAFSSDAPAPVPLPAVAQSK